MFKFLIILFLVGFIIVRLVGAVVKMIFGANPNQSQTFQSKEGVNVNKKAAADKKSGYSGGEYIDYEEVD